MKSHKYWSIGALITMFGTFYTGYKGSKEGHKYLSPSVKTCLLLYICILKNSNQKLLSGAMHNNFNNMLLIAGIDKFISF